MQKKTILLNGPSPFTKRASYGGGKGGFVRNVLVYVTGFRSDDFDLEPCYHSVRQQGDSRWSFVTRLISDVREVLSRGRGADGMHILAQYRTAIYREFGIVLACRWLRLPFLYEVKAGAFIDWLTAARPWERRMAAFILGRAAVVLCEGEVYVDFLEEEFGIVSHYFPNFVLDEEVPADVPSKLENPTVRVLFVGFCYAGKGVFELVDGCRQAAASGVSVELTLVGEEHEDFARYLDSTVDAQQSMTIKRAGRLEHGAVLEQLATHDVFCMPSRHSGEGHTNTVNEAMMTGMVIVTTRHGFLERVLAGDCSYFLDDLTPEDIAAALVAIDQDRDEARRRAANARRRLLGNFTSGVAFRKLESHYETLTRGRGRGRKE